MCKFNSQHQILIVFIVLFSVCFASLRIQADDRVSFSDQVTPILQKKCYSCHSEEKSEGGLRLDSKEAIERGGDSQEPIFGTSIERSEVIKRVTSDDPDYRMPPKGKPLETNEITLIQNWIQQGGRFDSQEKKIKSSSTSNQQNENLLEKFFSSFSENSFTFWGVYSFVILTILVLIIESRKQKISKLEPESSKSRLLQKIHVAYYVCGYLILGFVFFFFWHKEQLVAKDERIEKLNERATALQLRNSQLQGYGLLEKYYGKPPRPKRLDHPTGLMQTYYRGNDERSPDLYNGGYYRTSKIEVRLSDSDGKQLKPGDKYPDDGAIVEFRFNKPMGTSQNLYQDTVINKTFISGEYPHKYAEIDPRKAELEALVPDNQWVIRYQIPKKNNATAINGVLYVYFGRRIEFGIVYGLKIKDGRIEETSDLWMGNLLCFQKLLPPRDFDYITQEEWFDYKPIPIPKRHKKYTPELLGEDEHLKKKAE